MDDKMSGMCFWHFREVSMTKEKIKELTILLMIILLLASMFCCCYFIAFSDEEEQGRGCTPMPEGFSKADLVGTWVASSLVHPQIFDTLILREDGMYKQIIHIEHLEGPATEYETDWQPWRLEYDGTDIGYLHMQGMRKCAILGSQYCDWLSSEETSTWDFCLHRWLKEAPGETILLVNTYQENSKHHFSLELPQGMEASPWRYIFQEPD
jgi:hypothetical protein